MNMDVFLTMLIATAIITILMTQAIKNVMSNLSKGCWANLVAGIVALVVSVLIFVGYIIIKDINVIDGEMIVYLVALVILSWIFSMVGYDKMLQLIEQVKSGVDIEEILESVSNE